MANRPDAVERLRQLTLIDREEAALVYAYIVTLEARVRRAEYLIDLYEACVSHDQIMNVGAEMQAYDEMQA